MNDFLHDEEIFVQYKTVSLSHKLLHEICIVDMSFINDYWQCLYFINDWFSSMISIENTYSKVSI